MYIQIDDDTFIQYDSDNQTTLIISKSSLEKQINALQTNTPTVPTDDVLLAWAKENYPGISQINDAQNLIANLQAQLDQLDSSIDISAQASKAMKAKI
jgi:hypothetical protein